MASTASPGTVLVFSIINSSSFIHFTCLRVVYRDFLWLRFTKCAQTPFILLKLACTTTVQYRMVYFVSFQSFWPFNSKLGSIYSFQLSGGLAPWQCCFLCVKYIATNCELVLIEWNWIPLIQLNYWCVKTDNTTRTRLLWCLLKSEVIKLLNIQMLMLSEVVC